jgi:cysteine desulfuration protein SufE
VSIGSIPEIQDDIVEEFSIFEDWQDKYAHIIDLGRDLTPLDDSLKTEANIVRGCQAQVWLHAEESAGVLQLEAESDALIVNGLIAMMMRVYSGQTPADILANPPTFLSRIGLDRHLSQNRTNGLHAMMKTIQRYAVALNA